MSDDGADMGIGAGRALKTILGGEPSPAKEEGMSPAEMRTHLLTAPDQIENYDDAARKVGKIVLRYLLDHPEDQRSPAESEYEWPNGIDYSLPIGGGVVVTEGIHDRMEKKAPGLREELSELGISGFQWGWGVNAAKYALDLPPVPNPAIVTIGSD